MNEFGETKPALCSTTNTCTHTKYKITHYFLNPKIGKCLTTALEFWVKSKINRRVNTDYITVTDTIISSGLSTES